MSQYSIEQNVEMITHHKSREYFKEVMQSYVIGSYRSAVVMLYSVVICDLIYKLKELKDSYEDSTAISILEKVEKVKTDKPESGEWEVLLLKEIEERTFLLEPIDKANLYYLRTQRHLSAHPVLSKEDLLISPNKETVRSLMRNMLEGILTKSAVMSTKVFETILEDLSQHRDFFINDITLEKHLDSRYLRNINEHVITRIFRQLWSITFKCQSEECKMNRMINYRTIKILYKKYKSQLNPFIKDNATHFSKFEIVDIDTFERLFALIGHNKEIYELLEDHGKTKLKEKANTNWTLRIKAPFLSQSMSEHFISLEQDLFGSEYPSFDISKIEEILLFGWAEEHDCVDVYYDFLIKYFTFSTYFDMASNNFENYIKPNLSHFSKDQLLIIYKGINDNSQCNGHRMAKIHNSQIKTFSDALFDEEFDYNEEFPNVLFS
ncbi:hypothetical protein MHH33_05205 [Paenisporosarcina sp. FSL H8-0542]|uniref:hypothetical protein n=1 Tax=Paenisporosarcina sp. FSL H8-0542 TaxID=2921401 RepID=UPI00315A92BC